jgi:CrcB protein
MLILAVGAGGALGAIARYVLGGLVHRLTPSLFPYGTFTVNLVGCLCFGLVVGLAESRFVVGPGARAFVLIGMLGGFTTFSSFTFETLELVRSGQLMQATVNVGGQVVLGFVALWAGLAAGRAI